MLSIAICDDELIHCQRTAEVIRQQLTDYALDIQLFTSPKLFLETVENNNYTPQISILDIQMEYIDGITLAQMLNRLLPRCAIIFLTSFLSMATEVYETEHVYFIVKDQIEKRIRQAVERALQQIQGEPMLVFRTGTTHHSVPCRDVLFLERVLRRTRIKTIQTEEWVRECPDILLSGRLEQMFVRCHQSYWVNLSSITDMDRTEFVLFDHTHIPISRTYRNFAQIRLQNYWGNMPI